MKTLVLALIMAAAFTACGTADDTTAPPADDVTKTEGALLPNCPANLPNFWGIRCSNTPTRSICGYNIGYNIPVVGCRYAYGTTTFPYFAWSDCVSGC